MPIFWQILQYWKKSYFQANTLDSSIPFAKAKKILEKVGLEDQLYKKANKISGGQAQRAAIAADL
ncbi:MAG: hypothetical protein CM1200mP23_2850 [Nitrososphaerota archaeon]|nr:MAG: hypothetical protein CM1200mP23_2850 [Nitrososphaerota archaeon]